MIISAALMIVIGIAVLAFLLVGYWLGGRTAAGGAQRLVAEAQLVADKLQQQLQQELALAKQSHSQLVAQQGDYKSQVELLAGDLAAAHQTEKQLGIQVSSLVEKLNAESARVAEKNRQIETLAQQHEAQTISMQEQQHNLANLREQLGQSHEQAKQLELSTQAIQRLEVALAQAQDLLKSQSEQLGKAGEQARQLETAQSTIVRKDQELAQSRLAVGAAQARIAELEMAGVKELESAAEKVRLLQENKDQLTQEFQNLANKIFDAKQQNFSEQSRQGLDAIIKPFKDQLESFRQRVDQIHTDTVQGQSSMKTELEKLVLLNNQITMEASNLTRALKGDKKLQGTWGEQKVEFLLEQAGLRKGIEFEREPNFKDEDAKDRRPDFVVHLPEDKHIIVDSKVSLVAYTNYVAAETEEERSIGLAAHMLALRNHIDGLAAKKYPELSGMNSPDFVFMFMAVEPAYLLAAEHNPGLFQAAYEKRIAIVTATTLLPVLRVVANLWSIQRQNLSTKVLAEQATKIHSKLRIFVEKMEKLGGQINTVHSSYNETFKTLHEGKGSLTKIVDGFVDLGVKVVERLPSTVTGHDDLEIGGNLGVSAISPEGVS